MARRSASVVLAALAVAACASGPAPSDPDRRAERTWRDCDYGDDGERWDCRDTTDMDPEAAETYRARSETMRNARRDLEEAREKNAPQPRFMPTGG
jgi:hypothetical protein